MKQAISVGLAAALFMLLAGPAQSQDVSPAQEIVVTAVRTGAPVWRVRSGGATLVLVGAIDDIAAGTNWRPEALAETVRKADRVMFPQMRGGKVSPFALVNYYSKWKRRARLPEGQRLSTIIGAGDSARLQQLARQGLAPADYDRWHPLHLAFNMQGRLRKQTGMMEKPTVTVARAADKYKVTRMPIDRVSVRPLAETLFRSQPAEHVPCLRATIGAVEAGPGNMRTRSHAWANKQVQAALRAPGSAMSRTCWPVQTMPQDIAPLAERSRAVLRGQGITLAVLNLDTLARDGGLLDELRQSGLQVEGPAWR